MTYSITYGFIPNYCTLYAFYDFVVFTQINKQTKHFVNSMYVYVLCFVYVSCAVQIIYRHFLPTLSTKIKTQNTQTNDKMENNQTKISTTKVRDVHVFNVYLERSSSKVHLLIGTQLSGYLWYFVRSVKHMLIGMMMSGMHRVRFPVGIQSARR